MTTFAPGGDVVTVRRASLVVDTRYGSQRRDWATATSTDVRGVSVQPVAWAETDTGREYTATHLRLFAPHTADLRSTDRVAWRGTEFEIDGEPAYWHDDDGAPSHVEATLKRLAG